jgi:hypothetical protein
MVREPLWLEPLEDRTLLSVSITGTIFGDIHSTGVRTPDDPTVPAATVFLDANGNGKIDQPGAMQFSSGTGPVSIVTDATGTHSAPIQVTGLGPSISSFTLSINITTNAGFTGPVGVYVVSPADLVQQVAAPPQLFNLGTASAGGTFNVTLSDAATTSVPSGTTTSTGPFRPITPFGNASSYVYNDGQNTGNPNGGWELFFFKSGFVNATASTLKLNSWSISFGGSELTTQADANGGYTFSNLVPGTYNVSVANATVTHTATVTVPDNTTASNADVGVTPAAQLAGTAFQVAAPPGADWGSQVHVSYTIVNRGTAPSSSSTAEIRLSSDASIDTTDQLLGSVAVGTLQPGDSVSGTTTVTLPGSPGSPPTGFGAADLAFLGLGINDVYLNQGNGIDLAPAVTFGNHAVTTSSANQIDPSLAVDPLNAQHLVMAYTDYSLNTSGYGGVGVAESNDGGTTWNYSSVPVASFTTGGPTPGSGHATVAFQLVKNGSGVIVSRPFISFMAVTYLGTNKPGLLYPSAGAGPDGNLQRSYGMLADNGIFIAGSDDGGLTWNTPAAVAAPNLWAGGNSPKVLFDALPYLAIDTNQFLPGTTTANTKFGTMYVTWTRAYPKGQYPISPANPNTAGTDIMLATSTDGHTWTSRFRTSGGVNIPVLRGTASGDTDTTTAEGGGIYNFSQATVAPNGTTFFGYQEGALFRWAASTNQGASIALFSTSSVTGEPFFSDGSTSTNTLGTSNAPNYPTTVPEPFRTFPARNIVADPFRNGTVYAVEAIQTKNDSNPSQTLDQADIYFARTNNTGTSWQRIFTVGGSNGNLDSYPDSDVTHYRMPVNDDDGNNYLRQTPSSAQGQQVISVQADPRLFVDSKGDILIAWYDSRRDPSGTKFDIYATVSVDGGQTFSPNFRLTDTTIDPTRGTFTDPAGQLNDTLGDIIGVTAAGGVGYVAWTDTRGGNRDIYFTRFALAAPPPSSLNRFDPAGTPATAADLGTISGQQSFPRLFATGGAATFYKVTPGASGSFLVTLSATTPVTVQAFDASGKTLLAQGAPLFDAGGHLIGQQLLVQGAVANQPLLVEVSGVALGAAPVPYSLTFLALTGDFGTAVTGQASGSLPAQGIALYALAAPVAGSVEVQVNAGPGFTGQLSLTILNNNGTHTLGTGTAGTSVSATAPIAAGQVVLLQIKGATAASAGLFTVEFNVRDQFQTANTTSLFFPVAGSAPVTLVAGNLNGDGVPDIATANTDLSGPISVLLNDGTGLFGAPQTYDAGTGTSDLVGGNTRTLVLDKFNGDTANDLALTNFNSADVSVVLNRGDGTFSADHRSDAVTFPGRAVAADFNGDGKQDLAVFPVTTAQGASPQVAILLGHGDGTFEPPLLIQTGLASGTTRGVVGDFNGDGNTDFAVFSTNAPGFEVYLGNGDGTFAPPVSVLGPGPVKEALAADLNGDGKDDLVVASGGAGAVFVLLSTSANNNVAFATAQPFSTNTDPAQLSSQVIGLALADMGTVDGNGNSQLGAPDGRKDLLVITQPIVGGTLPQLNLLALRAAAPGSFAGFAHATQIALGSFTGPLAAANFAHHADGRNDIAILDDGQVRVIYNGGLNITPNTTQADARNLGAVTHTISPTQVIAPGFEDVYFTFTVPTEAAQDSGPQVVDIAAVFGNQLGAGLKMEVLDAQGNVLGSGRRIRLVAEQGTVLTLHIFGAAGDTGSRGAGTYTFDIDVLPQVVSLEAQSLLPGTNGQPGGPVSSLVLTFQGNQLDRSAAQNPLNYRVVWAGADGVFGTSDDEVMPIDGGGAGGQSIVFDPGANTQVASGRTYANTVRQTVTLLFAKSLPAGSYEVDLDPNLVDVVFNAGEEALLHEAGGLGHTLVNVDGDTITAGAHVFGADIVKLASQVGNLDAFEHGTPFLTNLHDDLGAVLNSKLTGQPDAPTATQALLDQVVARIGPAAASGVSFLVIVLDPVSAQMADPGGNRTTYDLTTAQVNNGISHTFIEVGGPVELMVLAAVAGTYTLNIGNVQADARGAAVVFGANGTQTQSLTQLIRDGQTTFQFNVPGAAEVVGKIAEPGQGAGGTVTASNGTPGPVPGTSTSTTSTNVGLPESTGTATVTQAVTAAVVSNVAEAVSAAQNAVSSTVASAPAAGVGGEEDGGDSGEGSPRRVGRGLGQPPTPPPPDPNPDAGLEMASTALPLGGVTSAGLHAVRRAPRQPQGVIEDNNPRPIPPQEEAVPQDSTLELLVPEEEIPADLWETALEDVVDHPEAAPELDCGQADGDVPAPVGGEGVALEPTLAAAVFTAGLYASTWADEDEEHHRQRRAGALPV